MIFWEMKRDICLFWVLYDYGKVKVKVGSLGLFEIEEINIEVNGRRNWWFVSLTEGMEKILFVDFCDENYHIPFKHMKQMR